MSLEKTTENAFFESVTGVRKGDKTEELEEIREYILQATDIVVPNWNGEKVKAINEVLKKYGVMNARHLEIHTSGCDVSRMPAITKALMALDVSESDLVIARGRLGIPGSGSMLVIMDKKGRILSGALSSSHIYHGKSVSDAVIDEMSEALERVGFTLED